MSNVNWLAGWYASRLHAVTDSIDRAKETIASLCGQVVYRHPQTERAKKLLQRGVKHCSRCKKLLIAMDKPIGSEERVIQKIRARRELGLKKYGVSVDREDLVFKDWLQHAQAEAMDFAIYLERLEAESAQIDKLIAVAIAADAALNATTVEERHTADSALIDALASVNLLLLKSRLNPKAAQSTTGSKPDRALYVSMQVQGSNTCVHEKPIPEDIEARAVVIKLMEANGHKLISTGEGKYADAWFAWNNKQKVTKK